MFTPLVRLLLIILGLIMAIYFYSNERFISMGMMLISAGLLIHGYYKNGTVYAAFQQLKKENFNKAERLLSKIKNPEKLAKSQKSYYHFSKGILASNNNKWEESYLELNKALNLGLRTKNDTSIVLLNLADVEFERKNFESAINYLKKVRTFELNQIIKKETEKLELKINAAQQRISPMATFEQI